MAKSPAAKPAVSAAAVTAAVSAFAIRMGAAPTPIERKIGAEASPFAAVMRSMPAPVNGAYANFFVPAEQPAATITDAGERAKALKDNARKLSNSLSGQSRRLAKKDATLAFALRTVEENGVLGVCVYRVEPETTAAATTVAATAA